MYHDTRQIEKRIDELESDEELLNEAREEMIEVSENPGSTQKQIEEADEAYHDAISAFTAEDGEELADLRRFREEIEPYCDWLHGEHLVAEDDRKGYLKDYLRDVGDMPDHWITTHINWDEAVEDFFGEAWHSADLGGETYYVRAS